MKVLWFTPIPPEAALQRDGRRSTSTGFWIHSLIALLAREPKVELAVAYEYPGKSESFMANGVQYFPLPGLGKYASVFGVSIGHERRTLQLAAKLAETFEATVIHVHGVESQFGLLRNYLRNRIPLLVSIQGLMGPCAAVPWGDRSFLSMVPLQGVWDLTRGLPSLRVAQGFRYRAIREQKILRDVDGVLGRTEFDRNYAARLAPKALYFPVGEVMRPGFYQEAWSLERANRHAIFSSGRLSFQKGMHILISALAVLRETFPDVTLNIAGDTHPTAEYRYLRRLVRRLRLERNVHFPGWLPESRILGGLRGSHIYVNPSFIENSSNSLAEAMLFGIPCVATCVGGTPSLVKDGSTGILCPPGDAITLARCVGKVFDDDMFATSIGRNARVVSLRRHEPGIIVRDLLNAYGMVTSHHTHFDDKAACI